MSNTRGTAALKLVVAEGVRERGALPEDTKGTLQDQIAPEIPDMPKAFEKNTAIHKRMRAAWEVMVKPMGELGMLTKADGPALEMAIRHYVASQDAHEELMSVGPTIVGTKGVEVKNPADVVFRGESETFLKYCQQLGLTFAARARIRVAEKGESDDGSNPFA